MYAASSCDEVDRYSVREEGKLYMISCFLSLDVDEDDEVLRKVRNGALSNSYSKDCDRMGLMDW